MELTFTKTKTKQGHIILKPPQSKRTLIFIHGLGDSAENISTIFSEDATVPPNTKVICVQAPYKQISKYNEKMNTWFDFTSGLFEHKGYSYDDVETNAKMIFEIIEEEVKQYNSNCKNIFVGGFSQGCCMSLYIAFKFPYQLGGIIGLSGMLFYELNDKELLNKRKNIPIFIGHGYKDNIVNYTKAMKTYENLKEFDNISFNTFNYEGHWVYFERELKIIKDFIEVNS